MAPSGLAGPSKVRCGARLALANELGGGSDGCPSWWKLLESVGVSQGPRPGLLITEAWF